MVQLFEEINDALVYELYFTEDFASESVFFMKYAEKLFVNIAALNKDEKGQSINKIFETLSEKDNEIRQNLKVMDTRLSKLVMPIKSK
jgi:hypothetical protein